MNSRASYLSFSQVRGALLLHLLTKLYEHISMAITPNLGIGAWVSDFSGAKINMALLDRLTHHCHIVKTDNEFWRFEHSNTIMSKARPTHSTQERRPQDLRGIQTQAPSSSLQGRIDIERAPQISSLRASTC